MSVIEKKEELEAFFHDAGKTRERWRVGTEYEKVGIDRATGKAIPYFGPRGIERILRELIERFGWEPEEQDGHIIALKRDKARDSPGTRRADRARRRAVRQHPLHLRRI